MQFLHLSDLHFHTSGKDNTAANELLEFIGKKYPKHRLIVTGDIADDGMYAQFANARAALEPFRGRVYISPGNHDYGAAGNFYSREKAERFDEMLSDPLDQGGSFARENYPLVHYLKDKESRVVLIALDTNLETVMPFDFACGRVGKKQRKALRRAIESPSAVGAVKMVMMHHHPFIRSDPFMELKDARKLMRILYYRADVLLFGHRHKWESWRNLNGIGNVLASDNSPGKRYAREITVKGNVVKVEKVPIR